MPHKMGILLVSCALATALGCQPMNLTPTKPNPTTPPTTIEPAVSLSGVLDIEAVREIQITAHPIVPVVEPWLKSVYTAGLAAGNNPRVFSKLGDCMTESPHFLSPFAAGSYDLGQYESLASVITHFAGTPARVGAWTLDSFGTTGLATASGFNVAGPLDPTWANPKWCHPGETPIACEYRVARPSIAVIMFGTNDVTYTEVNDYNRYLREVVAQTLDYQIIPLLSTFPARPENLEKTVLLNQIVIQIAQDYHIPLINLYTALVPLPNQGIDPADTIHLSVPPDGRVDRFRSEDLQYGFPVRNLVTLQALEAVLAAIR